MKFEEIIGHKDIVNNLMDMVKNDKINHAILFEGINGIGKKYTANIFANSILCESDNPPCGQCPKCLQFKNNSNPDFMFINSENETIKKSQITDLIDFLSIRPFHSKYKVAIIEDFHKTTPEGQNALLKTLEEAPDYGKIILLSENNKSILETVLSRSKIYMFYPISKHIIMEYLVDNYRVKKEEALFYANYSNGSIGRAIKILKDENFKNIRKETVEIFDHALKGQSDYVISNLKFFKDQENLEGILDIYISWLRDLVILKTTGKGKYLYNSDYEIKISSETHLSFQTIDKIKNKIINLKKNLKYNIREDLAIELLFIDILEECK